MQGAVAALRAKDRRETVCTAWNKAGLRQWIEKTLQDLKWRSWGWKLPQETQNGWKHNSCWLYAFITQVLSSSSSSFSGLKWAWRMGREFYYTIQAFCLFGAVCNDLRQPLADVVPLGPQRCGCSGTARAGWEAGPMRGNKGTWALALRHSKSSGTSPVLSLQGGHHKAAFITQKGKSVIATYFLQEVYALLHFGAEVYGSG